MFLWVLRSPHCATRRHGSRARHSRRETDIIQPNEHVRFLFVRDPDGYRIQFVSTFNSRKNARIAEQSLFDAAAFIVQIQSLKCRSRAVSNAVSFRVAASQVFGTSARVAELFCVVPFAEEGVNVCFLIDSTVLIKHRRVLGKALRR
jgi:hypothetical protein